MVTQRVDVSEAAELRSSIKSARQRGEDLILTDGGVDLAVVKPLPSVESEAAARARRQRALAGFRAAAGSWADVDVEAFKARVRADRDASTRPLPDL